MNSHEFQCALKHQTTNCNCSGPTSWEAQLSRDGTGMICNLCLLGCAAWLGINSQHLCSSARWYFSFPLPSLKKIFISCVWGCPSALLLPPSSDCSHLKETHQDSMSFPYYANAFVTISEHWPQFTTGSPKHHRAFPFAFLLQKTCFNEIQNKKSPTN